MRALAAVISAFSLRRTGHLQAAADASAKASALRNSAEGPSLGAVKSITSDRGVPIPER